MHQTVGNILRATLLGHPLDNEDEAKVIVDNALATAMHVMRAAVSMTLGKHSPGSIAFHRDMFLNIPLQADLLTIQQYRQILTDQNLLKANQRRRCNKKSNLR